MVPGAQRVEHEVEAQQLPDVVDDVPAQTAVHARLGLGRPVVIGGARVGVGLADDDQAPGAVAQHVDRGAVEHGQRVGGDDLLGRAHHRAAVGEVDDLVEVGQDRVDVVGDQQHRDVLAAAHRWISALTDGLVGDVEAVQRLVEHQQLRPADQGLGDQQPLLLAAGALPDRAAA